MQFDVSYSGLPVADKYRQTIEVYVPRHDLADEWQESLEGINAKVIHVYPRTGGKWDKDAKIYPHPIMCQRADYVRDLEEKGHSIYGNACLSRTSGEQFCKICVFARFVVSAAKSASSILPRPACKFAEMLVRLLTVLSRRFEKESSVARCELSVWIAVSILPIALSALAAVEMLNVSSSLVKVTVVPTATAVSALQSAGPRLITTRREALVRYLLHHRIFERVPSETALSSIFKL